MVEGILTVCVHKVLEQPDITQREMVQKRHKTGYCHCNIKECTKWDIMFGDGGRPGSGWEPRWGREAPKAVAGEG